MHLKDAALAGKKLLDRSNIKTSLLDCRLILSFVTGLSKEQIIFNPDKNLTKSQQDHFFNLIDQRSSHMPLSHITKKREFYGHEFIVGPEVLDPRPDSEILVELVNEIAKNAFENKEFSILEIGAGSGCLTISILKSNLNAKGLALELSSDAIDICRKNITKFSLNSRLKLFKSDLFAKIDKLLKFDFIISNPPYISKADIEQLEDEVRVFEPRMALDGGVDGLDFYRKIAQESKRHLNPNGLVIVEIGKGQEDQVVSIFQTNNFSLQDKRQDLAKIIRVLSFRYDN